MIEYVEDVVEVLDKKVVLLQSGGLDSGVLTALLSRDGYTIHHLFIDYGQNTRDKELEKAKKLAEVYGGEVHVCKIDMPWLKDSTLLVGNQTVGEYKVPHAMGSVATGVYVPMRNHVFLSIAASFAESIGVFNIASAVDGNEDFYGKPLSGSPDKHPTFIRAIENSLTEGSSLKHVYNGAFNLITPLLGNSKEDTIKWGLDLGVDFSNTWSCYNNGDVPCGECCSCVNRKISFANLGLEEVAKNISETP